MMKNISILGSTGSIGRYMVLVPFIAAVLNDTGGYFAGMFFGRHKLAPVISPKKTIEGVIGGAAASVLGMLIYALVMGLGFGMQVNYFYAILFGLASAGGSVFGDLCFSVIKRQTGIKDYGTLFPGHGGVLDRFDSIVFVGAAMELLLEVMPVVI